MKRLGLTPLLPSATLFLALHAGSLPAQDNAAPPAANPPTPEGVQRMKEIMQRFDKDGDGNLDDAERAATKEAMKNEKIDLPMPREAGTPESPEMNRRRMLAQFDKNKDGRLDDEERAAAKKMVEERGFGPGGESRAELMKRFDKNGNGRLDDEERAAMPEGMKKRIAKGAAFMNLAPDVAVQKEDSLESVVRSAVEGNAAQRKKFDENGDGKLDDREWAVVRRKIAGALDKQ